MRLGARFPQAFFARPCLAVARDLIGAQLVRRLDDGTLLGGRIVEVEAYLGDGTDPAAHSHTGPTQRNRAMFGPPGRLYVYRSYGVHLCANVVCEPEGRGAGVLLRALEPLQGGARMRIHRGLAQAAPDREIASGPGKLARALALTPDDYGRSLLRGRVELRRPPDGEPGPRVFASARIGLTRAADLPYRFYDPASACVSRARSGAPTRASRSPPA